MRSAVSAIPWYRTSWVNTLFALAGLLVPPLLWFVCFNLITGEVYYSRASKGGRLETWSIGNRYLAYLLLGAQIALILYLLSSTAWVSATSRPEAEAVVARYYDALREPATVRPPEALYAPEFWGVVSRSELATMIESIGRELGAVDSSEQSQWEAGSDGLVELVYDVRYERGRMREVFVLG